MASSSLQDWCTWATFLKPSGGLEGRADLQGGWGRVRSQVSKVDGGAAAHVVQELQIDLFQEVLECHLHRNRGGRLGRARLHSNTKHDNKRHE